MSFVFQKVYIEVAKQVVIFIFFTSGFEERDLHLY